MKKNAQKKRSKKSSAFVKRQKRNISEGATNIQEILEFNNRSIFKISLLPFFLLFSTLIILASLTIGIPGDEPIDASYGKEALSFYTSGGQDTSFVDLTVYGNRFSLQKYYGAGFEMLSMLVSKGNSPRNIFKIRHFMTALCGIAILLFIALLSKELVGWFGACISLIFAAASPTLIGHMLFNSKDVPFALGFIIAIYFMLRLAKSLPSTPIPDIIGLTLGITIATSIRIGGILTIFYLIVLLLVKFLAEPDFRKKFFDLKGARKLQTLALLAGVAGFGTLLGLLWYPNFFLGPIQHVKTALTVASDFPARILMLFEGDMIYSTSLPTHYLAKSLAITLPLFIFLAFFLLLLFGRRISKVIGTTKFVFLLFTVLFPIIYLTWSHAAIYNGWRHILFFYPTLLVLCGCSVSILLSPFKKNVPHMGISLLFIVLIGKVLFWQVNNHQYQYSYYNEFVGGCENAFEKYDGDYQQLGTSAGVDWLIRNDSIRNDTGQSRLIIASNNANAMKHYFDTSALNIQFLHTGFKDLRNLNWDYAVMSTLFVTPKVMETTFPPADVIHELKVGDKPITYIIARKSKDDYFGLQAIIQRDFNRGIQLLQNANRHDPKNFNVWLNLAHAYSMVGNGSEMIKYAYPYVQLYPSDWAGHYVLGTGYLFEKDYPNAQKFLVNASNLNPAEKQIYLNLLKLYTATGEMEKAKIVQDQLAKM